MSTQTDIRTEVSGIVKDDSGKLVNPTDYDQAINTALMRYSRHKPLKVLDDVSGDGTNQILLPVGWSPEFSSVLSIEYPIGDFPPTLLDEEDYYVIDRAGIVTLDVELEAADSVRVTYTMLRTADDIPDIDLHAFCFLAASICLELLANSFTQDGDSTINADVVDHKSKGADFTIRAKKLMSLYKDHMGIKDNDTSPAASAVADLDMKYPGGSERLTHPRWARKRR
jgi:hypothetical protein